MVTKAETDMQAPADDGWTDVEQEGQVKFENPGDVFTGKLLGWSTTENDIPQAHFESAEHGKVFINCGWDLKRQLKLVKTGWMIRIEFTGYQEVRDRDTQMMLFRVQYRK